MSRVTNTKPRSGALAVPETFALVCPWCQLAPIGNEGCTRCQSELSCGGFGNVKTRFDHQITCMECACDLRYLPASFDWEHVLAAYRKRGESLDGNERAAAHYRP